MVSFFQVAAARGRLAGAQLRVREWRGGGEGMRPLRGGVDGDDGGLVARLRGWVAQQLRFNGA